MLAGLHVLAGLSGTGVLLNGPAAGIPNIELHSGNTATTPCIDFVETNNVDYSTRLISQGGVLNVSILNNTTAIFKVNGSATVTVSLTENSMA